MDSSAPGSLLVYSNSEIISNDFLLAILAASVFFIFIAAVIVVAIGIERIAVVS